MKTKNQNVLLKLLKEWGYVILAVLFAIAITLSFGGSLLLAALSKDINEGTVISKSFVPPHQTTFSYVPDTTYYLTIKKTIWGIELENTIISSKEYNNNHKIGEEVVLKN